MNVESYAAIAPSDTLFIHGNLASNTWWEPSIEIWKKLAQPGFEGRFLLGEWRGCGKSPAPASAEDLAPSQLADDYIKELRARGVTKTSVVAHSTGGLIALYAMLKAPELFDRAVLLDPVGASGVQFEKASLDAFTQMSRDKAYCATVMGATIHGNDPASPLFKRIVDDAFGVAKENWHGVPAALRNIDISADLAKIQHPILVLHGQHDVILPVTPSEELAKGLPNGQFKLLKDQGHSANVENPPLFVELVNDFLFNRK